MHELNMLFYGHPTTVIPDSSFTNNIFLLAFLFYFLKKFI